MSTPVTSHPPSTSCRAVGTPVPQPRSSARAPGRSRSRSCSTARIWPSLCGKDLVVARVRSHRSRPPAPAVGRPSPRSSWIGRSGDSFARHGARPTRLCSSWCDVSNTYVLEHGNRTARDQPGIGSGRGDPWYAADAVRSSPGAPASGTRGRAAELPRSRVASYNALTISSTVPSSWPPAAPAWLSTPSLGVSTGHRRLWLIASTLWPGVRLSWNRKYATGLSTCRLISSRGRRSTSTSWLRKDPC